MATTTKLNQALRYANLLDQQRTNIATQYSMLATKYAKALTPIDWWNDGVTLGMSAKLALAYVSMLSASRNAGVSYADILLQLAGRKNDIAHLLAGGYVPVRANTDPQMIAYKMFNAYQHKATQFPNVRPLSFEEKLSDTDWQAIEEFLEAARRELDMVSVTDAVLSANRGSQDVYDNDPSVKQYMRVIHPELSRTGSCGLCIAAATRWYSKSTLMPIHAHCHCTTAPVVDGEDWLLKLGTNSSMLNTLYTVGGSTSGRDLKKFSVSAAPHGELGHVLINSHGRVIGVVDTWTPPDKEMGRTQLQQMAERVEQTMSVIKRVQDTMKPEKFTFGSRTFTIKPDSARAGMLARSLGWHEQTLRALRSYLGQAS